jgi:uncharacterized protein YbjQ (UPF0145 family)
MATCTVCGGKTGFMMSMCEPCMQQQGSQAATRVKEAREQAALAEAKLREQLKGIVLTTTQTLDGCRVSRVIDVISAEFVFKPTIFQDIAGALLDMPIAGSSSQTQTAIGQGRMVCLNSLRQAAIAVGANAVLGVALNYTQFSGHGNAMVILAATGTAVVVEPASSPNPTSTPQFVHPVSSQ